MADVTGTFYAGEARVGYGTQLLVGQNDGSPETFKAVADVVSIQPGEMTTAVVEKTHLRSPNRHREKIATISDRGPFTIMLNWRPEHGSQSNAGGDGFAGGGLLALFLSKEERNFQILISDGSPDITWPFRGVVTRFQPGTIGVEEKIDATVEITPLDGDDLDDLP